MNNKSVCVISLLLLCITSQAIAGDQPALITITGRGEVKVKPNQASISFGIETRDADVDKARQDNAATAAAAIATLKKLGIQDKDIQTTYTSVYPQYQWDPVTGAMSITPIYYVAQTSITFLLRNLDDYDRIVSALYKAGINRFDGITFSVSDADTEKYNLQAKTLAAANAKKTAAALLKELGAGLGRIYSVSVASYGGPIFWERGMNAADGKAEGDVSGPSISAGETTISADVTVVWEIVNK